MKIVRLAAENVKRIRAVEIRPDGNVVVIGGRNGQGKSSVLDSIVYALAGKRAIPAEPLRQGETKAEIVVELDDLVVKRTFTAKDSYLVVTTKEGAELRSPQQILDRLVSAVGFDPLEFMRLTPADQRDRLRDLVGIDFSLLDGRRAKLYDDRRDLRKRVKELEGKVEEAPHHEDAPESEVSVVQLAQELKRRQDHNQGIRKRQAAVESLEADLAASEERINELNRKLEEALQEDDAVRAKLRAENAALAEAEPEDEDEITARLDSVEADNARVRANARRAELERDLDNARGELERAEEGIEAIDSVKAEQLAAAEFPIDGLSFDEERVLYGGVPLDQASQAEQIRVTTAIGLAMNPELPVLMIRDGSLLDTDNLALVAELAAARDAQVWIERVGEGAEVSVVIEDGAVKG